MRTLRPEGADLSRQPLTKRGTNTEHPAAAYRVHPGAARMDKSDDGTRKTGDIGGLTSAADPLRSRRLSGHQGASLGHITGATIPSGRRWHGNSRGSRCALD